MAKSIKCVLQVELNGNKYKIEYPSVSDAKKAINEWKKLTGDTRKVRFI